MPFLQGIAVDPADILVQTGCGAILSNIFSLMCEEGDGILVPAPYYPGFDSDMKVSPQLFTAHGPEGEWVNEQQQGWMPAHEVLRRRNDCLSCFVVSGLQHTMFATALNGTKFAREAVMCRPDYVGSIQNLDCTAITRSLLRSVAQGLK